MPVRINVTRLSRIVAGLAVAALLFGALLGGGPSWPSAPIRALTIDIRPGWTDVSPSVSPPPMAGAMMAYSSKAHQFVLFGGWNGTSLDSTWVYSPRDRSWNALRPAIRPLARGDGMFVYTERADTFILFGGWHEGANETYVRLADTWSLSLATGTWTERHPVVSPSPRSDSEVAYDPLADAVLLVGGFNGAAYLQDVWSYTPSNDSWTARSAVVHPSPRADGRMVYAESLDRFILFGGNDYNGPNFTFHHLADTWTYSWNANVWTPLPMTAGPSARDYPTFAFDPVSKLAFLTAGFGDGTILNDLWAFDTTISGWVNLTPEVSPPPRFAAVGGFDLAQSVLVLFSGVGNTGLLADTWHYALEHSSGTPGLSPIVVVGVGSLIVTGVAAATLLMVLKRRRSPGPP